MDFEGDGKIEEFVGGYHDAQQQRAQVLQSRAAENIDKRKVVEESPKSAPSKTKQKKLSYKLQRELEALPQILEELEVEIAALQDIVNSPDFSVSLSIKRNPF